MKIYNFEEQKRERKIVTDMLTYTNDFINEVYSISRDITEYDKLIKKEYDKIYSKFIDFDGISIDKLEQFIRLIPTFIDSDSYSEEKMNEVIDLVLFTNLVNSNSKFLFIEKKQLKSIIDTFYCYEISPSSYQKYLSILLNDNVQEALQNTDKTQKTFCMILEGVNFDNEDSKVIDDIILLIEKQKHYDEKIGLFDEDFSFKNIYDTIYNQMFSFNEFCDEDMYNERQFIELKKVLKFNHLTMEKQNEFIECIKQIDKNYQTLIDKIRMFLSIIDIYSRMLDSKIVSPDFSQNRSRR